MTVTTDVSTATSIQAADSLVAPLALLSTALSTLTADAASPTSLHVSSAVSAQASLSASLSTQNSTITSTSTVLSTALSTLTLDAGAPTSAHVSSAVSASVLLVTALSVSALSTALSTVQSDWSAVAGNGGTVGSKISSHYAAALQAGGGVQVDLATDLSTALSRMQ